MLGKSLLLMSYKEYDYYRTCTCCHSPRSGEFIGHLIGLARFWWLRTLSKQASWLFPLSWDWGFSSPTKWCPTLSNQFDIIKTIFHTVYYLIFPHQYSEILYTLRFNWIIPYFELESLFQDKNILYYSTL